MTVTRTRYTDWIQTFSGKRIYPLEPDPNAICIEDIAHSLALKCRFAGHCKKFYSVAEHSWRCVEAKPCARNEALAILLHDAAEAYLPDVPRPIKRSFGCMVNGETMAFSVAERQLVQAVEIALGVEILRHADLIKRVDNMLLATEARDLMGVPVNGWPGLPEPLSQEIRPWSPEGAEERFMEVWNMYVSGTEKGDGR